MPYIPPHWFNEHYPLPDDLIIMGLVRRLGMSREDATKLVQACRVAGRSSTYPFGFWLTKAESALLAGESLEQVLEYLK